jgi:hypothetical protein
MNKTETSPRQFKNLLINPTFQLKLLGYFVALFILTTISLYSTTFLFFYRMKEKALNVGIPDGHIFFKFLLNQKHDLDTLFVGLAAVNFLLLIGVGFIISHRIAGPIFKLKKQLGQSSIESEDFKLRQTDFFQELEPLVKALKEKAK